MGLSRTWIKVDIEIEFLFREYSLEISELRDVVLDGFEESRGKWIDSTGNQLTYLPWCGINPSAPMGQRYLGLWSGCNGSLFDDAWYSEIENVVCVKCSTQYTVPSGYSCLETDFGMMVIKSYNQKKVSATEARALCAADADYVHLPTPKNSVQNMWYVNYAKKLGFTGFWLGINGTGDEWRTDTGYRQTYLPWKLVSEVLETTVVFYNRLLSALSAVVMTSS